MEQTIRTKESNSPYIPSRHSNYLTTFSFKRGSYGLRISVIGCMELIGFENNNSFVRGLIEFRDKKIPVVDPRIWYDAGPTPLDSQTCVVMVEPSVGKNNIKIGVIVEDISEVLNIASYNMDKNKTQRSLNVDFILKIGREKDVIAMAKLIEENLYVNNTAIPDYL